MGKLGIKTIDFELSGHFSNSNVVGCHFLVILITGSKMAPKWLQNGPKIITLTPQLT